MNEQEHNLALALRASVLARAMIAACGRFLPYAARLDRAGQVLCLADGLLRDDELRIEALWDKLGKLARVYGDRGGAVIYDAVVHDERGVVVEAIVVDIRHGRDAGARAYLPYERLVNDVVFGPPQLDEDRS